jgi:hypothetical protein
VLAGERRLRAFVPRNSVLFGRQLLAPLFIGFLDFGHILFKWIVP